MSLDIFSAVVIYSVQKLSMNVNLTQDNDDAENVLWLKNHGKQEELSRKRYAFIHYMSLIPWEAIYFIGDSFFPFWIRLLVLVRVVKIFSSFKRVYSNPLSPFILKASMVLSIVMIALHTIASSWIMVEGYSEDWYTAYNKAFYWTITTLTTIGYGDITPTTNFSRLFTTAIMIIGVGTYGVIFGNISRLILQADRHKEAKREKFNDLSLFLQHYDIPQSIRREVYNYYQNLMQTRLSDKDNRIISELPVVLQEDLKLYMKIKLIRGLHIFQDSKIGCLKMISKSLNSKSFSPGQAIINKGEKGQEMFIVAHGEVEVLVEGNVVATTQEGQFFGEIALIQNVTRTADVRAKSYCELYTLEKEDFYTIVAKYPELKEKFQKQYQKRSEDNSNKKAS
ncbi:MAG: cyclic nucleotide-binding domain-containing protein [Halobacteriovoraceae bacterium]|nr:cyclic nucleotide-binding domain-containing protein [Halobacteriovoraceae bacterium]